MADDSIATIVTKRIADAPSSTIVQTPAGSPDVRVIALPSWRIVLVRMLRVYLQSFVGFLGMLMSGALPAATAAVTGHASADVKAVLPQELNGMVLLAAQMALAPSVMTLSQNALELLTRLDEARPEWRA